ncbi:MAG TPA: hypothetical protein PLG63_06020 [bacterium]|nr:hypothetical protein [bacterium]HPM47217.1 hypothetical protein [bacterium]
MKKSLVILTVFFIAVISVWFLSAENENKENVWRIKIHNNESAKMSIYSTVSLTLEDLKKSKFCPDGKCPEEFNYCMTSYVSVVEMGRLGSEGFCDLGSDYSMESEKKWKRKISFKQLEKLLENYPEKGTRPFLMKFIILSDSPEPKKENLIGPFLFKTDYNWLGDI